MRLWLRILSGYLLLLGVTVLAIWFVTTNVRDMSRTVSQMATQEHASLRTTTDMQRASVEIESALNDYLSRAQPEDLQRYQQSLLALHQLLDQAQSEMSSGNLAQQLATIENTLTNWEREVAEPALNAQAATGNGQPIGPEGSITAELRDDLEALAQLQETALLNQYREIDATANRLSQFTLVIAAVGIILAVLLSLGLTHTFSRSLARLREATGRLAQGDFRPVAEPEELRDFQGAAESFNQMVASLRERDEQLQALNQQLSQRVRELNALYEVSRELTGSLDLNMVLHSILNECVGLFPQSRKALIHLLDETGSRLRPVVLSDVGTSVQPWMGMPVDQGVAGRVVRTGQSVCIPDTSKDPTYLDLGTSVRSLMVAPLTVGPTALGAISIDSAVKGAFNEDNLYIFTALANRAATAIENARLYEESQRRVTELRSLYQVALEFAAGQGLDPLFQSIHQNAHTLLQVPASILYVQNGNGLKLASYDGITDERVARVLMSEDGLASQVVATRHSEAVNQYNLSPYARPDTPFPFDALIAAPLIWKERVIGVITLLADPATRRFGRDDERLLNLFAQQAAGAFENVRLLVEQQLRSRQLALLNKLGQRLTTILDPDQLQQEVVQSIKADLGYAVVNTGLIEDGLLRLAATTEDRLREFIGKAQRIGNESLVAQVATTGMSLRVNDVRTEPRYMEVLPETRSQLMVPVIGRDGVIGVIDLQDPRLHAFTEEDQLLMEALSAQLAGAFDNARLYVAARTRAEQLAKILEISEQLRRHLDLSTILNLICRAAVTALGWNTALLMLRDYETEQVYPAAAAARDPDIEGELLSLPGRPLTNSVWLDERFRISQSYFVPAEAELRQEGEYTQNLGPRSVGEWQSEDALLIPIVGAERILGHISVDDPVDRKRPTLEQVQVLEIFAHQAAIAIEDVQTFQTLQEKTIALEEANVQLARASQLKSEFLANMSHELRTPLNSIIGFSEVLYDQAFGPLNERQLRYVNNVTTSGRHLLDLINDILDLSKIEAGRMELQLEPFHPGPALEEIYSIVEPLARKKDMALELELDQALTRIWADRLRFKQILYNLISNAVKFTPEGGSVTTRAWQANGSIFIAIKDTGIGIPEDQQRQIFDVFHRLERTYKRETEGTGLGLALVKRFVELHEGSILVESEPGKGSTFTLVLPHHQDAPPTGSSKEGESPTWEPDPSFS